MGLSIQRAYMPSNRIFYREEVCLRTAVMTLLTPSCQNPEDARGECLRMI